MKQSESQEQKALFTWIRLMSSKDKRYSNIFAIPNGAKRDKITAINLKREGVLSGVWDIFVPVPKNSLGGLFIEMKIGKNKLTDNQVRFKDGLENSYSFKVCYSWIEAKEAILEWLI